MVPCVVSDQVKLILNPNIKISSLDIRVKYFGSLQRESTGRQKEARGFNAC